MGTPLEGWDGDVYVTAQGSVLVANEACTDSGDHINYHADTHDWWDSARTFTVQCSPNGSTGWVTVTDYVMHWTNGKIVFNTARIVGTNNYVRISTGYYFSASQLGDCNSWELSLSAKTQPANVFQNSWELNAATTKGGSGKIGSLRYDGSLLPQLGDTSPMGFRLYTDKSAGHRWEFFGLLTNLEAAQPTDGIATQDFSFIVSGEAQFLTT